MKQVKINSFKTINSALRTCHAELNFDDKIVVSEKPAKKFMHGIS